MSTPASDDGIPASDSVRPTVWIPRPREDAEVFAAALSETGIQSLIAPVMSISIREVEVPLDGVGALLFTSANGVRAFAQNSADRDFPVYAVGGNTADEARGAGFGTVRTAGGDVDKLADLVAADRKPDQGGLLHVAGSERAGDLAALLAERSFTVDRRVLYDAVTVDDLPDEVASALEEGAIDAIAMFSPRTARIVCDLLIKAERQDAAPGLTALCLSPNVAEAARPLDWREIFIAETPNRASMLHAAQQALQTVLAPAGDPPEVTAQEAAKDLSDKDRAQPGEIMNDMTDDTPTGDLPDAETVIDRFGGIRPMAQKLGVTPSTIQGWKARNHIPDNRWEEIRSVAEREGIDLSAEAAADGVEEGPKQASGDADLEDQVAADGGETADKDETAAAEPADDAEPVPEEASGEKAEPAVPAAAVAQPPRRASGLAWIALLVALVSAAGLTTQSYWRPAAEGALNAHLSRFFGPPPAAKPSPPDPTLAEAVTKLTARIDALEERPEPEPVAVAGEPVDIDGALAPLSDRLAALEDALAAIPEAQPGETVDLTPVTDAVDALRSRVNAMDTRADGSLEAFRSELSTFADQFDALRAGIEAVTDRVAALENRLGQLETAYGGPSGGEAALVLTVGQLDSMIAASEPFGGVLQDIAALAPEDAAVQDAVSALMPFKDTAIPSKTDIIQGFADVALAIDRAERVAGADGWVDETLAELRGLVSIRRTDESQTAPAVSRAEAALDRGDLASAVAAVEPLTGQDTAIAGWVDRAKLRLTATDSLNALRDAALARLRMAATGG